MKFKILFTIINILFALNIISSQKMIQGTVVDETDFPLPGATILAKGTNNGTATDLDGKFQLEVNEEDSILIISYIGFVDVEINITDKTDIIAQMKSNSEQLDEVVVIGYGEVLKKDLTGSVTSINPDKNGVAQAEGLENYLQGRASGVYVSANGTEPGAASSIKIRGVNSLTGNTEPLYVVDGIIMNSATEEVGDPLTGGNSNLVSQNGINGVNPRDIESIEILKDASATAIYGSRGANGVILITTKKGKLGKPKFNYLTTTKVGKIARNIDVLNAQEYIQYQNEYRENLGLMPGYYQYSNGSIASYETSDEFMEANADSIPRLKEIDWAADTYKPSVNTNHRISVSGGGEFGNYYIAAGYLNNQGIVPRSFAKQGDFVINLRQNLTERLNLSTKVSAFYAKNSASKGTDNLGGTNNNLVRQIHSGAPFEGLSDNNFGVDFEDQIDGPRAWITGYDDLSQETRVLASLRVDYQLSDVFTYRTQFGGDYRSKERQVWYGTELFRGARANGEAGFSSLDRFRYNLDNTLLFRKRFNKNHRINGTVGVVIDQRFINTSAIEASNFASEDLRADGISFGQVIQPLRYNEQSESILSYLGRLNYTFYKNYLLTLTYRADGSSKFAAGNKYSHFPSIAFAWRMKDEKFLRKMDLISDAKLRLGWGLTGNQSIPNFRTITPFGQTENPYPDASGGALTSLVPTNLANPDLKWETTSQYNAGLDFGVMQDRFSGSIDVFYKNISDLLLNVEIGPSAGFTSYYANQGSLINKGLELSLGVEAIRSEKINLGFFGNISFNRNKIQDLGIPPGSFGAETFSAFLGRQVSGGNFFKVPANIFVEGMPTALFYGFETDGIISNDALLAEAPSFRGIEPQLGDVMLVDQNGDGNIDDTDLTIIGDPNPVFNFGFGSELSYQNLTLNFLFNGVYGNQIANGNLLREAYADNSANNIREEAFVNAWRPDNTSGNYPRVGYDLADETGFTDRIVEDGSFLRLSFISLTYALPLKGKYGIDAMEFSLGGQNLFLLTNYSGFDPEVNSFGFDPGRVGIDWNSFPNQRSLSLGLNLSF